MVRQSTLTSYSWRPAYTMLVAKITLGITTELVAPNACGASIDPAVQLPTVTVPELALPAGLVEAHLAVPPGWPERAKLHQAGEPARLPLRSRLKAH